MYDFQKANMWKRISAALCDLIALCIVVVGVALLLSTVLDYDGYTTRLEAINNSYALEYNVDLEITQSEFQTLSEDDRARYEAADKAFAADSEANYVYRMIVNLTLIIVTFSILIAFLLLEFLIPLLFGNGQTLGKKVFGVAVMREDGVKISPILLFARTILGKYTLETMVPVFIIVMIFLGLMGILGTIFILALFVLQAALLITTKARTPLHDKLAHTVCVDLASQMICDTPEAMLEYKKRIHAEKVEEEKY
jgi:uncharacterized RDD family membrane protein YckC